MKALNRFSKMMVLTKITLEFCYLKYVKKSFCLGANTTMRMPFLRLALGKEGTFFGSSLANMPF